MGEVAAVSDHFDGLRFFNPGAAQAKSLLDVLRWKLTSRPARWPDWMDDVTPGQPPPTAATGEIRVTLVNHSTVLVQMEGCNVLTDPIWSKRASPFSWIGPARHRTPGIEWDKLPRVHLVLVSHNHYDHLDLPTLRRLDAEHRPHFVAPLGLKRLLGSNGIETEELDWWQQARSSPVDVTCVPAHHFSARGLLDRNRTLWCGYVMNTPAGSVYFAGDTGFGPHFAEIGERCGPPRLALLPIGAYKPQWFMSPVHMGPGEAVRAHALLGAGTSIPIHHGTFQLTDEAEDEPVRELEATLAGSGPRNQFAILRNGGSVVLRRGESPL